jgi:MFS family permease
MIPDIVGMDRMMNAVSLNMAGQNTMRLLAPAAGGFIIGFAGFGWAFVAMAVLYGMALAALSRVGWQPAVIASEAGVGILRASSLSLRDIRDGARYIAGDQVMLSLLCLSFVSAAFAMPYILLLPGYVADIFGGGGAEVGLLISVSALGSLAGALALASLPIRRRGRMLLGAILVLALGLVAFAQTANYWIAAGAMVVVGIGSALYQALTQGLLHAYVDNVYRGRVMAVFMLQVTVLQVGTFVVALVAEFVGIRVAFAGLGVGLALIALFAIVLLPRVRELN